MDSHITRVFTINTFIERKQFPLDYVLHPGKSKGIYDRMFDMLKGAGWDKNYQMNHESNVRL